MATDDDGILIHGVTAANSPPRGPSSAASLIGLLLAVGGLVTNIKRCCRRRCPAIYAVLVLERAGE